MTDELPGILQGDATLSDRQHRAMKQIAEEAGWRHTPGQFAEALAVALRKPERTPEEPTE